MRTHICNTRSHRFCYDTLFVSATTAGRAMHGNFGAFEHVWSIESVYSGGLVYRVVDTYKVFPIRYINIKIA